MPTEPTAHIHDLTGPDHVCPCGWRLPPRLPVHLSIVIESDGRELVNDIFDCSSLSQVIEALQEAIETCELDPGD